MPLEELPGIQPTLFRELDHRIARTRLEHEPLPDAFLTCEDGEGAGNLVFRGERYDLSITLFDARPALRVPVPAQGSGVFVISNGAGVATNTIDQLARTVRVAGMIDLKRYFTEPKLSVALKMVEAARPTTDVTCRHSYSRYPEA